MSKRLTIPYLTRAKENDTLGFKAVHWVKKTVTGRQAKFYHGLLILLPELSASDMLLMHHLADVMDEGSLVRNTTELKRNFKRLIKKKYSDTTINRSFMSLAERKIIIKLNKRRRGLYKVNPQYIFRGSEIERKKSITRDLENSCKPLINRYRQETFDYDMARKKLKKKQNDVR